MKSCVIVFPASNCDRDVAVALEQVTGTAPVLVWHGDTELPPADLIVLPGGFSYGDYLRSGAMAARSPIMQAVIDQAHKGVAVLGICNGFQILTEAKLLPGALLRNKDLKFVCRKVELEVARSDTVFTRKYGAGGQLRIRVPVAHHDGNYYADDATLDALEGEGQVVFRYKDNPNGSARDIAGVTDKAGRVLGLMPHPERVVDPALGPTDGRPFFESVMEALS